MTAVLPALISADEPGVYDIPAAVYHRDPVEGGSLSASGAKKLMPPSCPALFRAWLDGETNDESDHFDYGRAAHREVLGAGDDFVVVAGTGSDENEWRRNTDKDAVRAVRDAGKTPIKPRDAATIKAMAAALRQHRHAAALLDPAAGQPERAIIWRDRESGVNCRALVDYLRWPVEGAPFVIPDYKTAERIDPESISKALWTFAYYGAAAWYCDAVEAAGLAAADDIAFQLIFQMKAPPYLVVVAQVVPDSIGWGHARNRKARDLYARCSERDEWPGFAPDDRPIPVQLPHYATYQLDAAMQLGELAPEGMRI